MKEETEPLINQYIKIIKYNKSNKRGKMPRQQKEESIFDLIPPEPEVRIKPPRFDSSTIRNSATLTGSLFGPPFAFLGALSPLVLSSDPLLLASMKSTQQKKAGTMGPAKVTVNAPNQFLKKHSKEPVLAEREGLAFSILKSGRNIYWAYLCWHNQKLELDKSSYYLDCSPSLSLNV